MEEVEESAFDQFLKIIGQKRYIFTEEKNPPVLQHYDLKYNTTCIGPCFYLICNTLELKFIEVSKGSRAVIGYSPEEIKKTGWNFLFQIMHTEDIEQGLNIIKLAWDFYNKLSGDLKKEYICIFYYRVFKKDGSVIKIQHQVINLEIDHNEKISKACIILTDVSHLDLPDLVKLTLIKPNSNICFSATAHHSKLYQELPTLSKREMEILKLIISGFNSRQIAEKLYISFYTVRTHRKNIMEKLGKKNTAELISYSLQNGMF
ncbi:hypothetical protein BH23BAC1_BH23BAC1_38500 [soil metagenome]